MRASDQPLVAKGLLYSTFNASYAKIRVQICNKTAYPELCQSREEIERLCAGGRVFLFVENVRDTTDFAAEADKEVADGFTIFNAFL